MENTFKLWKKYDEKCNMVGIWMFLSCHSSYPLKYMFKQTANSKGTKNPLQCARKYKTNTSVHQPCTRCTSLYAHPQNNKNKCLKNQIWLNRNVLGQFKAEIRNEHHKQILCLFSFCIWTFDQGWEQEIGTNSPKIQT